MAPLLILLKKDPLFGTLDIAPTTLPLIKKTLLSPLLIFGKYTFCEQIQVQPDFLSFFLMRFDEGSKLWWVGRCCEWVAARH